MLSLQSLKAKLKPFIIEHCLSYEGVKLIAKLRQLGVQPGTALMVHSSWLPHNGFRGRPADLIQALKDTVGPDGLLAMTSLTYHNEGSKAFLLRGQPMDVRRSPSRMGLLTEVFRRNKAVRRSLSPTHPILAWGARADWFIADHDQALIPFGAGSPFDRLLELDGWILTLDAPFSTITFTHFVEDRLSSTLPFPLYETEPLTGIVIDYAGQSHHVPVRVISDLANRLRREERLVAALQQSGALRRARVGNTTLLLVACRAMVDCAERLQATGHGLFDSHDAIT